VSDGTRSALAARAGLTALDRVLVAGSVHAGEEAIVLDAAVALRDAVPGLRVLAAPRYLAAVPSIERACQARGLTSRRLTAPAKTPVNVVVVDTYGDLPALYALARWVVLGGTFARIGLGLGQNMLEPLAHGVPVFFGPEARRWTSITAALGAIFPGLAVTDARGLAQGILTLEAAPETAARLRAHAAVVMADGGDATARHVGAICELAGVATAAVA
jgi:3-deoxy-D-manno-octulosonic-acid transferase